MRVRVVFRHRCRGGWVVLRLKWGEESVLPLATQYGTRDNKEQWVCRKGDSSLLCGSTLLRVVKSSCFFLGGGGCIDLWCGEPGRGTDRSQPASLLFTQHRGEEEKNAKYFMIMRSIKENLQLTGGPSSPLGPLEERNGKKFSSYDRIRVATIHNCA